MKNANSIMAKVMLIFGTFLGAQQAYAQTPPKVDPVPPKIEKLEEITKEPESKIQRSEDDKRIIEKRNNSGKVTEVEVKSGSSKYVVRPHSEAGNVAPGSVQSDHNRAPQWTIFEFGKPREPKLAPPPPRDESSSSASKVTNTK